MADRARRIQLAEDDRFLQKAAVSTLPWVEGAARVAKRKILIVDDDRLVQRTLNVLLTKNQYDTVVAPDAVLALSLARKEKPDLILLDIGLPGGGGFTVLERLRGIAGLGGIPVIVVSATDANN